MTIRKSFEEFYKTITPAVPNAGYEDITMDAAYLSWQRQQARIDELEAFVTKHTIEWVEKRKQLALCQLHNKQLVEAFGAIRNEPNESFSNAKVLREIIRIAKKATSTLPDQAALDDYCESKYECVAQVAQESFDRGEVFWYQACPEDGTDLFKVKD